MNTDVVFVVGSTGEGLAAARHVTRVRPFSGVRSHVNFTYVGRRERSTAARVRTNKRFLS